MKSSLLESIVSILQGHTPCSSREIEFKKIFLRNADIPLLSKQNTDPGHFTASGFVRNPETNKFVFIFHPKFQKWIQPGGHLDESDSHILLAAQREIEEETGLTDIIWDGTLRLDIHNVPANSAIGAHQHWDLQFGFLTKQLHTLGAIHSQWFSRSEIQPSITDDSVLRFVEDWQ